MERVTMHYAVVRNLYCESRSRVYGRTREELWVNIEDGRRRMLYGDVIETGTCEAFDPAEWEAERQRLRTVEASSCPMPPDADLILCRDAKAVDPSDRAAIDAIDPSRGSWKATRIRLWEIKREKFNAWLRMQPSTP